MDWLVTGGARLTGTTLRVPGDKSIGHRALLLAPLARAPITIAGLSAGLDNRASLALARALGVAVAQVGHLWTLTPGEPPASIGRVDCGNSGTTARLGMGLLSALGVGATLVGDASLSSRPMRRVVEPLRRMGANLTAEDDIDRLPIMISAAPLHGVRHTMSVASAQVKSALLLAGLRADGITEVIEPGPARDHTERMLVALGAPITRADRHVTVARWAGRSQPLELEIPGDASAAAFLAAAATLAGGGALTLRGVGVNPTRTGWIEALARMGAPLQLHDSREVGHEPIADLVITAGRLRAFDWCGHDVVRSIDEIPILAVLATQATGTTTFSDLGELRNKESDRIAAIAAMIAALGGRVEARGDQLVIVGSPLTGGAVDSYGDHRIAMAAAIGGLVASGPTRVRNVACVDTSYPGFVTALSTLGAQVQETA